MRGRYPPMSVEQRAREWMERTGITRLLGQHDIRECESGIVKALSLWEAKYSKNYNLDFFRDDCSYALSSYKDALSVDSKSAGDAVGMVSDYLIKSSSAIVGESFFHEMINAQTFSEDVREVYSQPEDIKGFFIPYLKSISESGTAYNDSVIGGMAKALSEIPERHRKVVLDWTRSGRNSEAPIREDIDDIKCASHLPDLEWDEHVEYLAKIKEFICGKNAVYKEAFGKTLGAVFDTRIPKAFRQTCFDDIKEYEDSVAGNPEERSAARLIESYVLIAKVYGESKLKEARHILKLAVDIGVDPVQQARKMIYHQRLMPETEKFLESAKCG